MSARGERVRAAVAAADYARLIAAIPYAGYLGIGVEHDGEARRYRMPYRDELIGNARKSALHGGTVAGFLELAMQLDVLIAEAQPRLPYAIDFAIDYWRSAGPHDCIADCRLIRSGRRLAQVQAECWQQSRDTPVAFARADFLLRAFDDDDTTPAPGD
ncbi:thioesterase [Salinisphaera orenii MK-B5]|uniref:Thioesterase n=1 Tax=Salinisphaera orenii MK-B5 TaxID=856730 RepID=A0A423PEI1_9GAMM|nr:PaaI family thioesterase [Salinisphaera orenii]ROO24041.1 thioesterase [Salinisphaera orenii MK-B5]